MGLFSDACDVCDTAPRLPKPWYEVTSTRTWMIHSKHQFAELLGHCGIHMYPDFVMKHILDIDQTDDWGDPKQITMDEGTFYGVGVIRINGICLLNGVLDAILKAFDEKSPRPSFHEVNHWPAVRIRDWGKVWTQIQRLHTPFFYRTHTKWLWYETTETAVVGDGDMQMYYQYDVGGVYGGTSVHYIIAGHACRKAGIPLPFAQAAVVYHNVDEWGLHPKGISHDLFWLRKGYLGYAQRKDW